MNQPAANPRTAREALILEALGELDHALERAAAARSAAEATAVRIEQAATALDAAAGRYAAEVAELTDRTKRAVTQHLEARINTTTAEALTSHRKAMQEAATLAFAEQATPALRDLARHAQAATELHQRAGFAREKLLRAIILTAVVAVVIGAAAGWGAHMLIQR